MAQVPATVIKDYSEYWEAQILFVRILQNSGLKVGVKDRLPLFKLWLLVENRMTGVRRSELLNMIDILVALRKVGREPPHKANKYV